MWFYREARLEYVQGNPQPIPESATELNRLLCTLVDEYNSVVPHAHMSPSPVPSMAYIMAVRAVWRNALRKGFDALLAASPIQPPSPIEHEEWRKWSALYENEISISRRRMSLIRQKNIAPVLKPTPAVHPNPKDDEPKCLDTPKTVIVNAIETPIDKVDGPTGHDEECDGPAACSLSTSRVSRPTSPNYGDSGVGRAEDDEHSPGGCSLFVSQVSPPNSPTCDKQEQARSAALATSRKIGPHTLSNKRDTDTCYSGSRGGGGQEVVAEAREDRYTGPGTACYRAVVRAWPSS